MDSRPIADTLSTLRDLVVERLRSAIVSGHSAPGTLFSVPTLAEEFGVSTTPVREALLELARVGLVTAVRNRGFSRRTHLARDAHPPIRHPRAARMFCRQSPGRAPAQPIRTNCSVWRA